MGVELEMILGLIMSNGFSCLDVNECEEDFDTGQTTKNDSETKSHQKIHDCPHYSECINTYAGYQCACYDGFLLNNGSCQVCHFSIVGTLLKCVVK